MYLRWYWYPYRSLVITFLKSKFLDSSVHTVYHCIVEMMKLVSATGWNQLLIARGYSSMLFVSRLSFYKTDEQLKELFSPFGEVTEARLVKDQRTQRPKGFGFVTYQSEEQAQKAIKAMNGRIVDGRLIFVEKANTKESENT